jgi:hypothetical protein
MLTTIVINDADGNPHSALYRFGEYGIREDYEVGDEFKCDSCGNIRSEAGWVDLKTNRTLICGDCIYRDADIATMEVG